MMGQRSRSSFNNDDVQSRSTLEGITDLAGGHEYDYGEDEFEAEDIISEIDEPIIGKRGAAYMRHGAFNVTTQQYPNSVNMVRCTNFVTNKLRVYLTFITLYFVAPISNCIFKSWPNVQT